MSKAKATDPGLSIGGGNGILNSMTETPTPASRKILVAIDGSPYSRHSLHYLAALFPGQADIHFHLLTVVPASGLPAGSEWMAESERLNMLGPATRKNLNERREYLQTATESLIAAGIAAERISSEARPSRAGASADILHEARHGLYDAVLLGRRGASKLEELIMGSVSADLFEKCRDVPLWIIDGEVDSRRFLVPVDGSPNSLAAVDHLAFILRDNPRAEITLFHSVAMLAGRPPAPPEEYYDRWDKGWCDTHLTRPDSLFHAPRQLLIDSGFPAERIFWLQTFRDLDPGRRILRQALQDDFGTIVIGRRGSEVSKGIFRGVSDRLLLMAEKVAVWIVG